MYFRVSSLQVNQVLIGSEILDGGHEPSKNTQKIKFWNMESEACKKIDKR